MNILMLAIDFRLSSGGKAEYLHRIAESLASKGLGVTVITEQENCRKESGSPCRIMGMRIRGEKRSIKKYIDKFKRYRSIIRENDIQKIIIGSIDYKYVDPFILLLVALKSRIPCYIFTFALELNAATWRDRLKRWMFLRLTSGVFPISSYTAGIVKGLVHRKEGMVIVEPGCNITDFKVDINRETSSLSREYGIQDRKVLLTVGRLVRRKGVDTVIAVMPNILKEVPDALYIIAGEGPLGSELREMVKSLGLGSSVIFSGYFDEAKKQELYGICDVFIMPCKELPGFDAEGFGIVFLEAAASGKPVIAGNAGGAKEAVEDQETGFLVDPCDPDDVKDKAVYLLKDPEKRREMGLKGRKRVKEKFEWNALIDRVVEALKA
ncbi:MAG: glycosyltransferase family 4 protein [Candidatus Omnitrophota bacterium]